MKKEVLCTLGPASMNERIISRLDHLGVSLFRINLSHTTLEDLEAVIDLIQGFTDVPICLDSEGAQVRTTGFEEGACELRENTIVDIPDRPVTGTAEAFNLHPEGITRSVEIGDFISIDFNAVLAQVVRKHGDGVAVRIINGGKVGENKAVTVDRELRMPPLTDKDRAALELGVQKGIRHFALSFAHRGSDVDAVRDIVGNATVISKIECKSGLANLDDIIAKSDAILIDRGDLSREVPLEQIPSFQKRIISRTGDKACKAYVATNLLESMVEASQPTRAEVNDIFNTLMDGADGLVLAAETAIGKYPLRCAEMVMRMIDAFHKQQRGPEAVHTYPIDPISFLTPPHGGELVHREASEAERRDIDRLPKLAVSRADLIDCEQIAFGAYSPLRGFMGRETLESVLRDHRLPDGTAWTMPIALQTTVDEGSKIGPGERIALTGPDGEVHSLLDVTDVWKPAIAAVAQQWFGTAEPSHPGVKRVLEGGEIFIGGEVLLVERQHSEFRHYELTPHQTRFIFTHKGWNRVVGFHGRNPAHRVHEYIQNKGLEVSHADGIYISPVIGPKKPGDFLSEPIMKSYQAIIEEGAYESGRVVLGGFPTYSRYCGPREAVFTALCRKNMGCSHFIIGRDHTGVGDFYGPNANRELFEEIGDIGITPIFFESIGYIPARDTYGPLSTEGAEEPISGTQVRETLRRGGRLPNWFIRDSVQNLLLGELAAGRPLFHESP